MTAVLRERIRQADSTVLGWPQPLDDAALAGTWTDAWTLLGRKPPPSLQQALEAAWSEPQRRYHDLTHLGECLALLGRWKALAGQPAEVTLALWFHDAVYAIDADDNEARSAAWAEEALTAAGVDAAAVERIVGLVLATCHDAPPRGRDAASLIDIDLAILGSPTVRFERYVRLEHGHVPDDVYRTARAALLQRFLNRARLYYTAPIAVLFEAQARRNLKASIDQLKA
jgi:predicted metal-dependent HD superfamily phosphohydrolase